MSWYNDNHTILHTLTSNQLFFIDAFFLNIMLLLLLYAHILVLHETLSFFNIQFFKMTFIVFLCVISKPYKSLTGSIRLLTV